MRQMLSVPYGIACIYEIVNTITGKRYVGSTNRYRFRFREHRRMLRNGDHHSIHFQNAYRKYGESVFVMRILEIVADAQALIDREQYWINFFGKSTIYNSSLVAGRSGQSLKPVYAINPKTGEKTKYSNTIEAAIQVHGRPEALCMINKACRTRNKSGGLFWTTRSKETLESITRWKSNRKRKNGFPVFAFNLDGSFAASFDSIADACQKLKVKDSAIRQALRSEVFRTAAGYTWSEIRIPKAFRNRKTKKVVQKKDGLTVKIWNSCREAAENLDGINHKGISSAATGYTKSHGGYQWEFAKS